MAFRAKDNSSIKVVYLSFSNLPHAQMKSRLTASQIGLIIYIEFFL